MTDEKKDSIEDSICEIPDELIIEGDSKEGPPAEDNWIFKRSIETQKSCIFNEDIFKL